ncbi:MAG TPA: carboxypeptidase-like regulatory domain-containing protein [Thermoclostridium sp.]|nr:carboxypeptidase regulatory-like domain-containing protein [Clostridiaceae bacterium]HOQ76239.1 carboxypeptidase-like regulatory domain-containing protein [Thermoclostridium sp.]HPU44993.1 carboxypeptidase-like regulatory domain-containing protein [Thermoclostridium sp.]
METQKEQQKGRTGEDRSIRLDKESIQYNNQDMDQHQRVDVNPSQLNTQNLKIYIRNNNDLSGIITGVACLEGSTERVANVEILLYFGPECKSPVHKTCSDANGNFRIDDLPPGFYTICAKYDGDYWYKSYHIKVLPGQKVFESIRLRRSC